jgi:hypothetical protein
MAAQNCITRITMVMPVAAGTEPVELRKTWMKANPVLVWITSSMLPMQKAYVTIITKPLDPFTISVHIIPRGRMRDESRISSAGRH